MYDIILEKKTTWRGGMAQMKSIWSSDAGNLPALKSDVWQATRL